MVAGVPYSFYGNIQTLQEIERVFLLFYHALRHFSNLCDEAVNNSIPFEVLGCIT